MLCVMYHVFYMCKQHVVIISQFIPNIFEWHLQTARVSVIRSLRKYVTLLCKECFNLLLKKNSFFTQDGVGAKNILG